MRTYLSTPEAILNPASENLDSLSLLNASTFAMNSPKKLQPTGSIVLANSLRIHHIMTDLVSFNLQRRNYYLISSSLGILSTRPLFFLSETPVLRVVSKSREEKSISTR